MQSVEVYQKGISASKVSIGKIGMDRYFVNDH